MSECLVCTAKTELFLCPSHIGELRANLTKLAQGAYIPTSNGRTASGGNWHIERRTAGLLDALADVVLKRTRLGGGGSGHRKRGDEMPGPFEPDTERGRRTAQGQADYLLDAAQNALSTIIRDLCESRAGQPRGLDNAAAPSMAAWLAQHAHTIACDEAAGQWWAEIDTLVRQIERAVDRPVRFELLGMCITQIEGGKTCDTALRAREDAIEVRCPKCRTVRRCDTVRAQSESDARKKLITWEQVLETNKFQPEGWKVNDRTLRHWRASGTLKPQRYRRPDGTIKVHRVSDADEELFKWGDVEQLRSKVPLRERKRTRAGG